MGCSRAVWGNSEVVWAGGMFFELGVCLLGCRQVARVLSELIWLKISCLWLELTRRHRVSQKKAVRERGRAEASNHQAHRLGEDGMDETVSRQGIFQIGASLSHDFWASCDKQAK